MNFLHKLAQRMSRLKGALLISMIATSACGGPRLAGPSATQETLQLSPRTLTLGAGQMTQFVALDLTTSGHTMSGAGVTWKSSNEGVAIVNESGLVTGLAEGAATITASSDGRSAVAPVRVTLTSPNAQWPNEPAGFTVQSDYDWSDPIATGNSVPVGASGWFCNNVHADPAGDATRVSDPTAPFSAPYVLQMAYPIGFEGGVGPANCWFTIPGSHVQELYVGFWWKVSDPWQGHPSGVNKLVMVTVGGTASDIIPELYGQEAPYRMRTALSPLGAPSQNPAYGLWLENNIGAVVPTLGVWHRVELYLKYGTSASSFNGIFQMWLDGTLIQNYSDVNYPFDGFDTVKFNPTWGGTEFTKTQNDYFWFGQVHMSTR